MRRHPSDTPAADRASLLYTECLRRRVPPGQASFKALLKERGSPLGGSILFEAGNNVKSDVDFGFFPFGPAPLGRWITLEGYTDQRISFIDYQPRGL